MPNESLAAKHMAICATLKAPKNQYNSFGKYNYRSCEDILEALKPLLLDAGLELVIDDEVVMVGNRYYVKATVELILGNESIVSHGWAREDAEKKGMDGSQITGTASSYARKYALNALFMIDDTKDADTDEHAIQAESKAESKDPKERVKDGIKAISKRSHVPEHVIQENLETEHAYTIETANKDELNAMVETLKRAFKGEISLTEMREQ